MCFAVMADLGCCGATVHGEGGGGEHPAVLACRG